MLFAILCQDHPSSLDLRMSNRSAHLDYLRSWQPRLVEVGPLLDDEGRPCGSLLVVDVADRAEAEAFASGDPYAKAGLFASTFIRAYCGVFRGGELVA